MSVMLRRVVAVATIALLLASLPATSTVQAAGDWDVPCYNMGTGYCAESVHCPWIIGCWRDNWVAGVCYDGWEILAECIYSNCQPVYLKCSEGIEN